MRERRSYKLKMIVMKTTSLFFCFLFFISLIACNNSDNADKSNGQIAVPQKAESDSLMANIMDDHDAGMGKMGKLSTMKNKVQQVIDSISKLPLQTQTALAPYKENLNNVLRELQYARSDMDKWMEEFNMDSAINNAERRIKYLTDEKLKVSKVRESIFSSLQKADSLIRRL